MDIMGTLAIVRYDPSDSDQPVYTFMLLPAGTREAKAPVHRCAGDPTLLRILEELLPGTEQRREALEALRATGHASIAKVTVPREQLKKYGLAPR